MLREIKHLLSEHGRLSQREMASLLSVTPTTLEQMIQLLIDKGQVRIVGTDCASGNAACKGCFCAQKEDLIIYELV
jgi:predicted transcriptional regulator